MRRCTTKRLSLATVLLLGVVLTGARSSGGATSRGAGDAVHVSAEEAIPAGFEEPAVEGEKGNGQLIQETIDQSAGQDTLAAALDLIGKAPFERIASKLEAIGEDESVAPAVRGAALSFLATAYENIYPSFALIVPKSSGSWLNSNFEEEESIVELGLKAFSQTHIKHNYLDRMKSVELYEKAAALGNATAQFRMGTLYATGALGVEQDLVKAVLNYYFAALNGNLQASMALGFRHSLGLGVPRDCKAAVLYYELAANQVVDNIEKNGVGLLNDRERLTVDSKIQGYPGRTVRSEDEEVVDYYKHAAEKGDVAAFVALGQIYFYGARGVIQDHARAASYFRIAASRGDATAQAHLGHLLVRGLGVEKNYKMAFSNFTKAADGGSPGGLNGLGYMYLYGLGVEQNAEKARGYFGDAAEAGDQEAHYNLGALFVSGVGVRQRDYGTALNYFSMAAQKGHTLATHKLAQMHLHGIGTLKNCEHALNLFKAVAERGESLKLLQRAFSFWGNENDPESALHIYLLASELGYEVAQANAAWLLDRGARLNGKPSVGGKSRQENDSFIATLFGEFQDLLSHQISIDFASEDSLRLYQLAAEQGNIEARLRVGDHYYYADNPDFELAAHHYKQASDARSAQGMFNLGYMHQHGIGLPRDFHLAKRFFDSAEASHMEAKVPAVMALYGLYLHRIYNAIVHQEIEADLPNFVKTLASWFATSKGQVEEEANSVSTTPEDKSFWDYELSLDMEDDTASALVMFILLVIVLLVRSRRQRLLYERQRAQHLHVD